jgi:integrase
MNIEDVNKKLHRVKLRCKGDWLYFFSLGVGFKRDLTPASFNCGKTNQYLGNAVSKAFNRYNLPFPPYALRDCYAIRAASLNVPPAFVAEVMGHSLDVHSTRYLKWIQQRDLDRAWGIVQR